MFPTIRDSLLVCEVESIFLEIIKIFLSKMNKDTRTSAGRSSLPKMVRGNSNFFLLPYHIKKSVMMLRKQKQVK